MAEVIPAIFNCVSTCVDMLKYSSERIIERAGCDFDYVVITWVATPDVAAYLNELKTRYSFVSVIDYQTNQDIGYVPNLRGMINLGFEECFKRREYAGLVNTDQSFAEDWLENLAKYATEDTCVNSVHISPIQAPNIITANCGVPTYDTFDEGQFNKIVQELWSDYLESEDQRGGWRATNTMPYLFHRKWWDKCGPWEYQVGKNSLPPDARFFQRMSDAGCKFTMSHSSIVYHHEAVERRGKRPAGTEHLKNEI